MMQGPKYQPHYGLSNQDFLQNTIAAIIPGSQPHKVNTETNSIAPQPLSITASGGHIIAINALENPISLNI